MFVYFRLFLLKYLHEYVDPIIDVSVLPVIPLIDPTYPCYTFSARTVESGTFIAPLLVLASIMIYTAKGLSVGLVGR